MRASCWFLLLPLLWGCPLMSAENKMENPLLESLLSSSDEDQFGQRLRLHGPVTDGEVPALIKEATARNERRRRNATELLRLNRSPQASAALADVAAHTKDELQYTIAMGGLLTQEDARVAKLGRPELAEKAFSSADPQARAVAVQIMVQTHHPKAEQAVDKALTDSNSRVRKAALKSAIAGNPAKYKPLFTSELLKEETQFSQVDLYGALAQIEDPALADVFRRSLQIGKPHEQRDRESRCHNALVFVSKPLPWVRDLVLAWLEERGSMSSSAFTLLNRWGGFDRQLLSFCIAEIEKAPPKSDPAYRNYMGDLENCRVYLGKLAGKERFAVEEGEQALLLARQRLGELQKTTP